MENQWNRSTGNAPSSITKRAHGANRDSEHKKSTPGFDLLEIKRTFQAPVDQLFQAFASAEALKMWWWPKGLFSDRVDIDFREGGAYFFNMKGYDQGGGGMTGNFVEILKNKRIVMTDRFSDENGNPITAKEAKMKGVWPEVIYITYDFTPLDSKSCHFTLSQEGIPDGMQKDCIQGWSESFDKLDQYLAKS